MQKSTADNTIIWLVVAALGLIGLLICYYTRPKKNFGDNQEPLLTGNRGVENV